VIQISKENKNELIEKGINKAIDYLEDVSKLNEGNPLKIPGDKLGNKITNGIKKVSDFIFDE
jgi:hypothetical protein